MSRILRALLPITPTATGRATVRTAGFQHECRKIAASVIGQGLPYEIIEARLRLFTAQVLLPARNRNMDDIESFVRAHWDEVDRIWRAAIESMMRTIDADPAGTLSRELGIGMPAKPQGLPRADLMERPLPGGTYVDEEKFKEGRDFAVV